MSIHCKINGQDREIPEPSDRRVVDVLREDLGLTGTKEGCGAGECGACTILVDGRPKLSCLMTAAQLQGAAVTTIEGIGEGESLHPVQEAFVEHGAVQCGFCTPGMVLSAVHLLSENPAPDRGQIRQAVSGHLCRCTGYVKIVDAVAAVAEKQASGGGGQAAGARGAYRHEPAAKTKRSLPLPLKDVRVLLPETLGDLWRLMRDFPDAAVYAGGTDLLVRMRSGAASPVTLLCLERIPELKEVEDPGDRVVIGAAATFTRLLREPAVTGRLPVLAKAAASLGSPLIRNMGTLGGNICTASPAGDTLPPLYALNARVELASAGGIRYLPIDQFITGPGRTELAPGEILRAVHVDKPHPGTIQHFEKVGRRNALACALVSMAALVRLSEDGTVSAASLAWGSVGPTVLTCPEVSAALIGRPLSVDCLREAAALVRKTVRPVSDIRAAADYRRTVAGNLLLRLAGG